MEAQSPDHKTIQALRQRLGWPQSRLAAELGITVDELREIERGTRRPSESTRRLLDLLAEQLAPPDA